MSDLGNNTNWSETDASNNQTPPNGWPEGMTPSNVNNSARADKGALKRFWNRLNATKTTAGSTTAYTLTYDVAAAEYYDGELFTFVLDQTCGASPTLNINSLGARNLRKWDGTAWGVLASGDIAADQVIAARYNLADTAFDIVNVTIGGKSLSASGYQELPGGTTIQWGLSDVVSVGSPATITFPVAFSATYSVQVTAQGNSGPLTNGSHSATSVTTTNFVLTNGGSNNIAFYWLAVGAT